MGPHQLRHTYATEIRRRFGVDSSIDATLIYAERNLERGREIARQIG